MTNIDLHTCTLAYHCYVFEVRVVYMGIGFLVVLWWCFGGVLV